MSDKPGALSRLIDRLHPTHVYLVDKGEAAPRKGDAPKALCGYAKPFTSDARWSASRSVCKHCYNLVVRDRDNIIRERDELIDAFNVVADGLDRAAGAVRRARAGS